MQSAVAQAVARQLQAYGFLTEIDLPVLENTINTYKSLGCWNHNGSINEQEYETLLDVFSYSHLISQRFPMNSLVQQLEH